MSRIGSVAVELRDTAVEIDETIKVTGPLGYLAMKNHPSLIIILKGTALLVRPRRRDRRGSAIQGTVRSLIYNLIKGVTTGFRRTLTLVGVGHKVAVEDKTLSLHLGFSDIILRKIHRGITITAKSQNGLTIFGLDKQLVGRVSAEIRMLRPVEPYKGKGIRYDCETVKTKEKRKSK